MRGTAFSSAPCAAPASAQTTTKHVQESHRPIAAHRLRQLRAYEGPLCLPPRHSGARPNPHPCRCSQARPVAGLRLSLDGSLCRIRAEEGSDRSSV
jgi:hypothetical protein